MLLTKISKRVFFTALLVSLVFPFTIMFSLSPAIDNVLIEETKEAAFRLANYLQLTFDLKNMKLSNESFSDDFRVEIEKIREQFNLYKISILSKDKRIVFSTNPDDIGRIGKHSAFDDKMTRGEEFAVYKGKESQSIEGIFLNADVVEAYVPIMKNTNFIGAFEIYYDITAAKKEFNDLKILFSLILFIVGFSLLLVITIYSAKVEESKSKHKKVEEDLFEEQLKTQAVFAAMGDNVIVQDREYKVLFQNEINRKEFGDRRGEYCFKVFEGIDQICDYCPVELTYNDGEVHRFEKIVQTPAGMKSYELVSSPLKNKNGEIIAGVKVVRDITERKVLEDQLRHSQKMEAMGTLTGGISHEFNNILTTVYGSAEILKDVMNSDDPLKKYVVAIYDSAQRAIDLTKGLLTYSRRQTTNVHSISLNDTIKKWESFIAKLIGPDLTFRVDLPENKIIVRADENQLQQVLVNVAANARDAMPDGGALIISLALFEMDNDYIKSRGFGKRGMYALLKVKDTGTGMTPKIREKVFEPFFTTKDVGRGTGLGLSIVYGIIKNHFGYIEVESIPGSGTTFLIYLPLVEESTPSSTSASV